jgi:hypothetical protein
MQPKHWFLAFACLLVTVNLVLGVSECYVSPGGSDNNACTASSPCGTLSHASAVLNGIGSIVLTPGTYINQCNTTIAGAQLNIRAFGAIVMCNTEVFMTVTSSFLNVSELELLGGVSQLPGSAFSVSDSNFTYTGGSISGFQVNTSSALASSGGAVNAVNSNVSLSGVTFFNNSIFSVRSSGGVFSRD